MKLVEAKSINHQQSSVTIAMILDTWERKDVTIFSTYDKDVLIYITVKLIKQKLKVPHATKTLTLHE